MSADGATAAVLPLKIVVGTASQASASASAASSSPPGDGSANDQATGGFPLREEDKDTPTVGPLATALALLAIALAVRRRLA